MSRLKNIATILGIVLGIVLCVIGICYGQHIRVYSKAIRICLECVGIG